MGTRSVALQELSKFTELHQVTRVIILSDSRYVVDHYQTAVFNWSKNKWLKRTGAPVLNVELWKELLRVVKKIRKRVEIQWTKGHSKNKHNKAVDKLAKQSAKKATKKLSNYVDVRRKLSEKKVELGSVKMLGQRISIRIITTERLKTHKVWKLKYEVISRSSPFCKNVDEIYCEETLWNTSPLKAGHSYSVRLNDNNDYPQISKAFREILKRD